jgi:hypothetical protein
MKTLFLTLVFFLLALFTGCQENSITDPLTTELGNKVQTEIPAPYIHGFIPLEGLLNDPYPVGNSFIRIIGQVEYDLRTLYVNTINSGAQRYLSVNIMIDADLAYFCTVCYPDIEDVLVGFISDVSEELIPFAGNSISLLEKTYSIDGREDGMVLRIRFLASSDNLKIKAMWLELPESLAITTSY